MLTSGDRIKYWKSGLQQQGRLVEAIVVSLIKGCYLVVCKEHQDLYKAYIEEKWVVENLGQCSDEELLTFGHGLTSSIVETRQRNGTTVIIKKTP